MVGDIYTDIKFFVINILIFAFKFDVVNAIIGIISSNIYNLLCVHSSDMTNKTLNTCLNLSGHLSAEIVLSLLPNTALTIE